MSRNVLITSNCGGKFFFSPIEEVDHSTYHSIKFVEHKTVEFVCYIDYCTHLSKVVELKKFAKALWIADKMNWSSATWDRADNQFLVFDRLPVSRNAD